MKKITNYILQSKLNINWDKWNITGVFGIIMTFYVIVSIVHQIITLLKFSL